MVVVVVRAAVKHCVAAALFLVTVPRSAVVLDTSVYAFVWVAEASGA